MDSFDQAILETFPLAAVGPRGGVEDAPGSGIRYLAASDGLWREVALPWIRVRHMVAPTLLPLPYGSMQADVELRCGPLDLGLVRDFNRMARAAAPAEVAAAIVWNEHSGAWRLEPRKARSSSASHVDYDEVALDDGDHMVVDLHSHGHYPAFFSGQDDKDDHGSMKFSLVVGDFNKDQPSSAMRLCMAGLMAPARIAADGQLVIINREPDA